MININKPLSDAEILGRVKLALANKHEQIDNVFRDLRIAERKSGIEITFEDAKHQLIDAYKYDVPSSAKTAKAPSSTPVPTNLSTTAVVCSQVRLI